MAIVAARLFGSFCGVFVCGGGHLCFINSLAAHSTTPKIARKYFALSALVQILAISHFLSPKTHLVRKIHALPKFKTHFVRKIQVLCEFCHTERVLVSTNGKGCLKLRCGFFALLSRKANNDKIV